MQFFRVFDRVWRGSKIAKIPWNNLLTVIFQIKVMVHQMIILSKKYLNDNVFKIVILYSKYCLILIFGCCLKCFYMLEVQNVDVYVCVVAGCRTWESAVRRRLARRRLELSASRVSPSLHRGTTVSATTCLTVCPLTTCPQVTRPLHYL